MNEPATARTDRTKSAQGRSNPVPDMEAVMIEAMEAMLVATPILGRLGLKDDEAWSAYSRCINVVQKLKQGRRSLLAAD